jgi:predicted nucleic acid-binding protein
VSSRIAALSRPVPATGKFSPACANHSPATGNLIPDVWFAALAIESGCEWITTDRDYESFPGLRWRHPLTGKASG